MRTRALSIVEALLVTFLWSTSYILIKIGLEEINPLIFASYRYTIASLILLLPTLYFYRKDFKRLTLRQALFFTLLGFSGYFIAQGLQFLGLYYLQPVTVTFILNLTPFSVLILSVLILKEKPSPIQLGGITLTLIGVLVFFFDSLLSSEEIIGILITFISGLGWAVYMIFSRQYLRENGENVLVLTVSSMALGSLMLLGTSAATGRISTISLNSWIIILWLSGVNTAFAFPLWNHSLKILKAYEQSILQNTMLIQITILANIFIKEIITLQKILGIIMVFLGVLIVQLRKAP